MAETAHGSSTADPFGADSYRHIMVDDAIINWDFEHVCALLVYVQATHPLPPAVEFPLPSRTRDHWVDMQAAQARLAYLCRFTALPSTCPSQTRIALARASVMALSFLAQSARGVDVPAVPEWEITSAHGIVRRFLTRWQGHANERYATAINAGWNAVAAEPYCPSLQVARDAAATGADVSACLSMAVAATSGPFVSGGSVRLASLLDHSEPADAVTALVNEWGLVPQSTPVASRRVNALEQVAKQVGAQSDHVSRFSRELALFSHPMAPTEQLLTTLWVTHLFMFAGVPKRMLTAMFACGKTAGWSAVIMLEHFRLLETINS